MKRGFLQSKKSGRAVKVILLPARHADNGVAAVIREEKQAFLAFFS